MTDDVRDIGGRLGKAAIAILVGASAAVITWTITERISRGDRSSQGFWFTICSAMFAFVLCGAFAGVVMEWWIRRTSRVAPAIPTARIKRPRDGWHRR